jgi:hypothetical protein
MTCMMSDVVFHLHACLMERSISVMPLNSVLRLTSISWADQVNSRAIDYVGQTNNHAKLIKSIGCGADHADNLTVEHAHVVDF